MTLRDAIREMVRWCQSMMFVRRKKFEMLKITVGRLRIDLDDARDRVRELEGEKATTDSRFYDIESDVRDAHSLAEEALDEAQYPHNPKSDVPVETV